MAATTTYLTQRLGSIAERFDVDPELRRDPGAALRMYSLAIADETNMLRALGELLEQVAQDITANADRSMLITNAPPPPPAPRGAR